MNELQIFNFGSNQVRTQIVKNELWFVATDVCQILDLTNTTMALNRLDEDERSKFNLGRQGEANVVNEFGLYNLVLSSRKPEAKAFKRWITHDVVPSIRKKGNYQLPTEPEDIMIETLKTQKEIKANLKLVQDDIHDLKQEINLSRSQKHRLSGLVRKNVYNALGGKKAQAYNDRNLRARLYSNHWREIKNYFDVEAYEEIPKLKFDEAVEFAELWEPSTELKMLIKEKNNQIPLSI